MITFSLRPSRRSTLPSIEASVSTFVVSWNEAAERNDSVASDAFVIPRISGLERRRLALRLHAGVLALERDLVHELARKQLRVAGLAHPHLLQHLAHDQLDVLVVDVDALRLVDLLHLAHEVQLGRRRALASSSSSAGASEPSCSGSPGSTTWPLRDEQPRPPRELVLPRRQRLAVLVDALREDRHLRPALGLLDVDPPADLGERRGALRVPRLEDLDDAREAVRDVRAGDAAGVERPHRQLRAGLADRLRGDDADRVADLGELARREERAVARLAHARLGAALEHRADRQRRRRRRRAPRRSRAAAG